MIEGLKKRIEALEKRAPEDLIIYAVKTNGEIVEARVKDVISVDGELKEGFSAIGNCGIIAKSGASLKDLDRILEHITREAEKDV